MVGRQTGKTKKLAGRIQRSLARRQKQQTARQSRENLTVFNPVQQAEEGKSIVS